MVIKYSLVHCYTDKNKGDAAIIIATTQLIHDNDENADITMFSTYGEMDTRLSTDHIIISNYANRILPALFPEPTIPFNLKIEKLRIFSFLWSFIKSFLMLISSNKYFLGLFLTKKELECFYSFIDSDVIISKGGSFLCTENSSLRQTLSLIRMLSPFVIARRYNKRSVIFSQSLGPIEGKVSQWLFKTVLSKVDFIYLRESLCLEKYNLVENVCSKVNCKVIPDSAFYLQSDSDMMAIDINQDNYNVGFTIVDHDFKYIDNQNEINTKVENYKKSIISSMKYLIDNENAIIHIFPQVRVDISIDGHNDMRISEEIENTFHNTKYEDKINFYNENWTPIELRNLYGKMDIFIGTRLHSVIFSLSVLTPSINIAYHGTKSLGILSGIKGLEKYVVDINTIDSKSFIRTIKDLINNKEKIEKYLTLNILDINNKLSNAMREICQK